MPTDSRMLKMFSDYLLNEESLKDITSLTLKQLTNMSIRLPDPVADKNDYLITFRALDLDTEERVVAFHGDPDFLTALTIGLQKLAQGSLTWRKDSYGR